MGKFLEVSPRTTCFGIDLSLTGTGLCAMLGSDLISVRLIKTTKKSFPQGLIGRIKRYQSIVSAILVFLEAHKKDEIFVAIEGYAYNSFGNYRTTAGELGILVRSAIMEKYGEGKLIEIAPTSLKKQIVGSGRATKRQMVQTIEHLTKEKFNHNIADAVGLAIIARRIHDGEKSKPNTKFQTKI